MRAFGHNVFKVVILTLIIIFTFCKKQETVKIVEQPAKQDSTRTKVQELMLSNQSDIEKNLSSLMKLIEEKELEINKTLEELRQKSVDLKQKEEQLTKIEIEIRRFRNISYFILVIGSILIIVSLLLILKKNKWGASNGLECI